MVERILAVSTAGRCGTTMTDGHETQPRRFRGDPGDLRQLFVPLAAGTAGEFPEAL